MGPVRAPRTATGPATVIQLAARRRCEDVLRSITLVFGGIHYGTIDVTAPYTKCKPIVLYVVTQRDSVENDEFSGPIDCLITDDEALAARLESAR
jgi:hypothetical protein